MLNYRMDNERRKKDGGIFIANTPAFGEPNNSYSPAYNGTLPFNDYMKANKSLFESATEIDGIELYDPMYSNAEIDFFEQSDLWGKLKNSLENSRSGIRQSNGKLQRPKTRLLAFDFETLGINNPFDVSKTGGISEVGIAETIVKGNKVTTNSHSIALGINRAQLEEYFKYFSEFKLSGTTDKTKLSTLERLSRYGGKVSDIFGKTNIQGIGEVITVNNLIDSSVLNQDNILRGLMNMAALGGISEKNFSNMIKTTAYDSLYRRTLREFEESGITPQTLATRMNTRGDSLGKKISNFFNKQIGTENTYALGFNINSFDLPIYNHFFHGYGENALTKGNTLDIYSAIQYMSDNKDLQIALEIAQDANVTPGHKRTSQEAFARYLGLKFETAAHHAGSDSVVSTQLLLADKFHDNKSLIDLVTAKKASIDSIDYKSNVFYALKSMAIDKNNGLDYFNLNQWSQSGIQRGRFYKINSIKRYDNGKVGVHFSSFGDENPTEFIKGFDSLHAFQEAFSSSFTVSNVEDATATMNSLIVKADTARRAFDDLYSTRGLQRKSNEIIGGYETLNQYYKAYQIVAANDNIGTSPEAITKIAETTEFDKEITSAIADTFGTNQEGEIAQSIFRNFKAMYGAINDEKEFLGYLQDFFDDSELNNYQKTLIAGQLRKQVTDSLEGEHFRRFEEAFDYAQEYSQMTQRDMFNMELFMKGEYVNINFESKKEAISGITRNIYSKAGTKNRMEIANALNDTVLDLYNRDLIGMDFFRSFYRASGVPDDYIDRLTAEEIINFTKYNTLSEVQPYKLTEMLVAEIQNTYVKPIKNMGFTYEDFKAGNFSRLGDNAKMLDFFKYKTSLNSGAVSLLHTRQNKYVDLDGNSITFGEYFDSIKDGLNISSINGEVNRMKYTLDRSEIRQHLIDKMGRTEESADAILRILSDGKNNTYGIPAQRDADDKTKYITQFAYSDEPGKDAFILINRNTDTPTNLSHTQEIMARTDLDDLEKIKMIKDEGYSTVFRISGIDKNEITGDSFFEYVDENGKTVPYSFDTIVSGDKDFRKINRKAVKHYYRGGQQGVENLDVYVTDETEELDLVYRRMKNYLFDILDDNTLSDKERNIKATKMLDRARNATISKMTGPVGYQALPINGKMQKVFIPTLGDKMASSGIKVNLLQLLTLETALKDYREGDMTVAKQIAKFSNQEIKHDTDITKVLGRMITDLRTAIETSDDGVNGSISAQFDEYFMKHFIALPMSAENNYESNIDFTFIDYLGSKIGKKGYFTDKSTKTVQMIINNRERIAQTIKESVGKDKIIYLNNPMYLNKLSTMNPTLRPVGFQSQNPMAYIKKIAESEYSSEIKNKYGLTLGFDFVSEQYDTLRKATAKRRIAEGLTEGDMELGLTLKAKQIDTTELITKYNQLEQNFDEELGYVYREAVSRFNGLDEARSRELLQEALRIAKNTSSNTDDSRGFLRFDITDSSHYLNQADIRTVKINAVENISDITSIIMDGEVYAGDDIQRILQQDRLTTGTVFRLANNNHITYRNLTGTLSGTVEDFLTSGSSYLAEDVHGMSSIKYVLGDAEKGTALSLIYSENNVFDKFKSLSGVSDAKSKEMFRYFERAIMDRILGTDVAMGINAELYKHGNASILGEHLLNIITYNVNDYLSKNPNDEKELMLSLKNAIYRADNKSGLKFYRKNGQFIIDESQMGEKGLYGQIANLETVLRKKAEDSTDSYSGLWGRIIEELDTDRANNVIRVNFKRVQLQPSMGGAMKASPRTELGYLTKGLEYINEYNTDVTDLDIDTGFNSIEIDGRHYTLPEFIAKSTRDKILNGKRDSSQTPIDSNTLKKYKSALKTVEGLELSTMYMDTPERLANSNVILDVMLDDIQLIEGSTTPSEMLQSGIYKLVDGKEVQYSNQLREIASREGKRLDNISALRIHLKDGMSFKAPNINGTNNRLVNQLLVPLYAITPVDGRIEKTQAIRKLERTLTAAKEFGSKKGLDDSQGRLNKSIEDLYISMVADLQPQDKNSYVYKNISELPIKNSGMYHAEGNLSYAVNAMTDPNAPHYWREISDEASNYRKRVVEAVKAGDINYDGIDIRTADPTGDNFLIRNGKLYYEDAVYFSREGLERRGLNFRNTGKKIFFNTDDFRPHVEELEDLPFFKKDLMYTIEKRISKHADSIIYDILNSESEYDYYMKNLFRANGKANKKGRKKLANDLAEQQIMDIRKAREVLDDTAISRIEALSRDRIENIAKEFSKMQLAFEDIAEDYLTEVGTFSSPGRYPTFAEAVVSARIKLAKGGILSRDDMRMTITVAEKVHSDNDGDTPFNILPVDENGVILSGQNDLEYRAYSRVFEQNTFREIERDGQITTVNNYIMGKKIESDVKKIEEESTPTTMTYKGKEIQVGSSVDLPYRTLQFDQTMVDKYIQDKTKDRLLTEIGFEDYVGYKITELPEEVMGKLTNEWNRRYGNMLKNPEQIAATAKVALTKGQVGAVSDSAYYLKQSIYMSMKDALDSGDMISKSKYNGLKELLFSGTDGILNILEQGSIDVKHVTAGMMISETVQLPKGLVNLFKQNIKESDIEKGRSLIDMSLTNVKDKLKKSGEDINAGVDDFIDAIIDATQDKRIREHYNKIRPNKHLETVQQAIAERKKFEDYHKYLQENDLETETAFRGLYQTLTNLTDTYNMGYYYDGILQEIKEDGIYVATEDGNPVLYKLSNVYTDNDGKHGISFKQYDYKTKKYKDKGLTIKGNGQEVQSQLQKTFGDFKKYDDFDVIDVETFNVVLRDDTVYANTLKFANLYSRGQADLAEDLLKSFKGRGEAVKRSAISIQDYLDEVSYSDFYNFIQQAEYVKANKALQTAEARKAFGQNYGFIDSMITQINKSIIANNRDKKTSTSEIFDAQLKRIARDISSVDLGLEEVQDFIKEHKKDYDVFSGYEDSIIDLELARIELSDYEGDIEPIMRRYKAMNDSRLKELKSKVLDNVSTTSDVDEIFNWYTDDMDEMRVGIEGDFYGRRFMDLSEDEISKLISYKKETNDSIESYMIRQTKDYLSKYKKDYEISDYTTLRGAMEEDIISLKQINESIKEQGAKVVEATKEAAEKTVDEATEKVAKGMNASGKEMARRTVGEMLNTAWDKAKDFAGTKPGKAMMGLAALGMVGGILDNKQSPLAPELNQRDTSGPTNKPVGAPASNKKTVYVDSNSGTGFKMSAKSRNKIKHMQMAQRLSAQTEGDTNVNIYDDRSQISNNWLERKFTEIV